ncbi:MAG: hypothetical protein QXH42_01585 [Thermoplasmata archaeon]
MAAFSTMILVTPVSGWMRASIASASFLRVVLERVVGPELCDEHRFGPRAELVLEGDGNEPYLSALVYPPPEQSLYVGVLRALKHLLEISKALN